MHGVTTALVLFLFVCVVWPQLIKNRAQYYAGFALVCCIILLDAVGFMISASSFKVFVYFANAILQIGAICVLFLSAGGITWRELGGEMLHAFEVIRRGEDEKEVIIPLRGQKPKPKEADESSETPQRMTIDEPQPSPTQSKPDSGSSIPLE